MSTVSPLVAAVPSVRDLIPADELGHEDQPQVPEDRNALDDLPQGALVMLTQLQPLRERPLTSSLAALPPEAEAEAEARSANVPVDQTMHRPMKQPSVTATPALVDARPALLAPRVPIAAQVLVQASVANALATPAQAAVDASAQQTVPLSSAGLPVAAWAQEPDRAAVASAHWARDQAVADKLVKPQPPQALPATQPLLLLEKSLHLHHVTRLAVAAKPTSEPKSAPEASTAGEGRTYLQVPFSKGNAVSLITVSKAGGERPEQLLLNPDSNSVSSYLSDHLAQVPDPRWRLADQQGHEDRHEQGRPDEEVEEESRQTLRDRGEQGGQQA